MTARRTWATRLGWVAALLALVAAPAIAETVITSGADLWPTSQGSSHTSFVQDPIPADFFCPGSPSFDGKFVMNGAPIVTDPPGVLGEVDTIVHRLDDATFDADGVATTRLQLMALSLVSAEPIDVGCATPFEVAVSLDGEQSMTEMRIVRTEEWGGTYTAPLSIHAKMVFTPVGGGPSLQVSREVYLGPAAGSYWTTTDRVGTDARGEPVRVDTDGDRVADSTMPGPSNFVAGMVVPANATTPTNKCAKGWCPGECCHCTPESSVPPPEWDEDQGNCTGPGHLHCTPCCKPCIIFEEEEPNTGST